LDNNTYQLILDETKLFKDQAGLTYAIRDNQVMSINDVAFENWLRVFYRKNLGRIATKSDIQTIIDNLVAEAAINGETIHLYNRVASYNDAFWYYAGNIEDGCQAVCITPSGWKLVNSDGMPTLFKKSELFLPQIAPVTENGDFGSLIDFVNIKDTAQKLLFLVSVASLVIPNIQYPACIFYGNEGSSKTTVVSMIRKIIDPSKAMPSVMSKKVEEMCLQLSKSHVIAYDNLDSLSKQQSDILCQFISGGSIEKRQLYTDAKTYLTNFKGCVLLNGVSNVVSRPDLIDRSVLFELQRINEEHRITEGDFWRNFDLALPKILGGLFDVISKAMSIYPTIKLEKTQRLGDFNKWGCAIAIAMNYKQEEFLAAYEANRQLACEKAVSSDSLAEAICIFMREISEWSGYMGDLYDSLTLIVRNHGLDIDGFPKGANNLSKKIGRCEVILKSEGIEFNIGNKDAVGRKVLILKSK